VKRNRKIIASFQKQVVAMVKIEETKKKRREKEKEWLRREYDKR